MAAPPRAYEAGLDAAAAEAARRVASARAFADRALAHLPPGAEGFAAAAQLANLSPLPGLPPVIGGSESDVKALESVAPLYFAQELEAAGLLAAAEGVVSLFRAGALRIGPGPSAEVLAQFWRERRNRAAPEERAAAYARLFGGGDGTTYAAPHAENTAFEPLLLDLAEAMHRYRNAGPLERAAASEQTRIRTAARALAGNLVPRAGGAALFLAEDAMQALGQAVEILKLREVQSALGVQGLWAAVRKALDTAIGSARPDPGRSARIGPHFDRARAGLRLVGWLADSLPSMGASLAAARLPRDAAILDDGTLWLQATLALLETWDQEASHG